MLCRLRCWRGWAGLDASGVTILCRSEVRWRQLLTVEASRTGDLAVETPQMSSGTLHSPTSCLFICLLGLPPPGFGCLF